MNILKIKNMDSTDFIVQIIAAISFGMGVMFTISPDYSTEISFMLIGGSFVTAYMYHLNDHVLKIISASILIFVSSLLVSNFIVDDISKWERNAGIFVLALIFFIINMKIIEKIDSAEKNED